MVHKVLEKSDNSSITIKLLTLYFLNVTDLLLTTFLLRTGMFLEVNKIMNIVINDTLVSILFKIVLPLVLIVILKYRLRGASSTQLVKANILINIVLIFYIVINVFHVVWIFMYYRIR